MVEGGAKDASYVNFRDGGFQTRMPKAWSVFFLSQQLFLGTRKKLLTHAYRSSRCTYGDSRSNERTKINKARAADHGGALDERVRLHPGNSRDFPRKGQACLHHNPDNRLSFGEEKSRQARQKGW